MKRDYIELITKDIERAEALLRKKGLSVTVANNRVRVYFPDSKDDRLVVPAIIDALNNSIVEFTVYYDGGFTKLGKEFTEKIIKQ